jgi:hypothetical protein
MHDDGLSPPFDGGGVSALRKATRCQLLPGPDNRRIRFAARWAAPDSRTAKMIGDAGGTDRAGCQTCVRDGSLPRMLAR